MGVLDSKKLSENKENELKKNGSGYYDPTAYKAIKHVESGDSAKFYRLLRDIFALCESHGFHLEGRIVVRDKETGRIWR